MGSADQVSRFFRAPKEGNPAGTQRSNLFVLRRDLTEFYGYEEEGPVDDPKCPMLAAIGMLSGIDLLAWTVTWPTKPTRADFEIFLQQFGDLPLAEAQALYQFRCAEVHSYGLYAEDTCGKEFKFTLNTNLNVNKAIAEDLEESGHYIVNFWALKILFLRCIRNFQNKFETRDGEDQAELVLGFYSATDKIGSFYVI